MAYQMSATAVTLKFIRQLQACGMAQDRIVKFCAQVGLRSISLVMTNFPQDTGGQGHVTS